MMYGKAILFGDAAIAQKILATSSPAEQKKLGRQVKNFDDAVWERERETIVQEGNYYKFTAAVEETDRRMLKTLLLGTGDKELVEVRDLLRNISTLIFYLYEEVCKHDWHT